MLVFMADAGDADQILQQMLQYQVQGILMASVSLSSGLAEECADLGIPVVLPPAEVVLLSCRKTLTDVN